MKATTHNGAARNGSTPRSAAHEPAPLSPRQVTIGDIAHLLKAELVGDAKTLITGVAGLDAATPGTIAFIEDDRLLPTALDSSAAAIIAPSTMAPAMRAQRAGQSNKQSNKPIVLALNPRLAFARVMEYLQPLVLPEKGIHPSAVIAPGAHIGHNVTIREFCYVGRHARIGDGAVLFPHVTVGDGAQLGNASILYPSVVISHSVQIGARVRIHAGSVIGSDGFGYVLDENGKRHKVPQVGTVVIEDDVEIGANVCIDRATMGATRIGAGTKIDNLVQVAHNCQVGRNVILCGQVGLSGSVEIDDDAVLAGQVGARDHVKIGKGSTLSAQSGIMTDVKPGELVMGSPAVAHRENLKMEAAVRRLPSSLRSLRSLEKQVQELQQQIEQLRDDAQK